MPDSLQTVIRTAVLTACVALVSTRPVVAQQPLPDPPDQPSFFSRYDFAMSAAALGDADERFTWDTHWRGDFDLVDYKYGRATFVGDYQALLGSEFRPFDPYQSNYLLEASGSIRIKRVELAGVLNHVSRHLGDRDKRQAVAENSLGVRLLGQLGSGGATTLDLRLDARKVIAQAYVDYTGMGDADVILRHAFNPGVGIYGRAYGELITVDRAVANRASQTGGRGEVGARFSGSGGALELFGGVERVINADPLDRTARSWAFVGFRLIGR
jgi:hypothetical protein